jgi:hypothetical protein
LRGLNGVRSSFHFASRRQRVDIRYLRKSMARRAGLARRKPGDRPTGGWHRPASPHLARPVAAERRPVGPGGALRIGGSLTTDATNNSEATGSLRRLDLMPNRVCLRRLVAHVLVEVHAANRAFGRQP